MSAGASWSITARAAKWFVAVTLGAALTMALVSGWFLRRSAERELAGFFEEEFEEFALLVRDGVPPRDELERAVGELFAHHAENPMGFRVWRGAGATPWFELESAPVLAAVEPTRLVPRDIQSGPDGLRWSTHSIGDELVVTCAIDGSFQLALWRKYWLTTLAMIGGATIVALLAGALFLRSLRGLFRDVAVRARAARSSTSDDALHVPSAPLEIQEITDALATMRANILQEAERTRLLATGIAHELSSPMQNLVVQSEVALMRERSPAELRELLTSQLEELRDLSRAVGNLVALCSMQSASPSGELEDFDLAVELELRLRRERMRAEQRGVELVVRCEGDLAMHGDREAVMLALCNLVSNAVQWSPSGSRVEMHVARAGERVLATVDDAGPGIPEDLHDKVFEPFFRGPSRAGERAGYGLGLSIARRAIERQAGSIAVSRSPAGGARLSVQLARVA